MQKRTRQYTVFKNGKIFPIGIFTLKVKTEIIFGVKIQIPISSKQKMGHIFLKKKIDLFHWFWNTVRVQGCCIDYSEFLMQWKSSVCGLVKRAGMEPCLPVPEDAILFDVTNAENHSLASTHQCNFLETWWEFRRIRTLSRITQHYQ